MDLKLVLVKLVTRWRERLSDWWRRILAMLPFVILSRKQFNRLLELSQTDPLTGLWNRRGGERNARNQIHAIQRANQSSPLTAVLSLDLDRFKLVNDTRGHPIGDLILKRVAEIGREIFPRDTDVFIRFGGDELSLVLISTELEQALSRAETLRVRIEADGIMRKYCGVTISIGVAMMSGLGEIPVDVSLENALKEADQALYRAKANGRNRVETA